MSKHELNVKIIDNNYSYATPFETRFTFLYDDEGEKFQVVSHYGCYINERIEWEASVNGFDDPSIEDEIDKWISCELVNGYLSNMHVKCYGKKEE